LEWYDFAIFAAFSPVISKLFFPAFNHTNALLMTFAVFSVGFFARPFGAIVFGYIGDTKGRKRALSKTIIYMTIATVLIGCLPGYKAIGILSPLLLVLFRLIQGFSVSGEFPGVMTFFKESFKGKRSGFFTSFSVSGTVLGIVLGYFISTVIYAIFRGSLLFSIGWRIPFLLSVLLGVVAYYLRAKVDETFSFEALKRDNSIERQPVKSIFFKYKSNVLSIIGLFWVKELSFYLIFVYLPVYLIQVHHYVKASIMMENAINMFLIALLLPLFGHFSDKIGNVKFAIFSILFLIIGAFPVYYLIINRGYIFAMALQLLLAIIMSSYQSGLPGIAAALFPANVRFSGLSLCINISAALFGGTAPFLAAYLIKLTGTYYASCYYLIIASVAALFCLMILRKKFGEVLV
jgi:MHS family proline/betaine transporter-like MFS transporter